MAKVIASLLLLLAAGQTAWGQIPEVTITRLDGQPLKGHLVSVSRQSIAINRGGEVVTLPATDVQRISWPGGSTVSVSPINGLQVELLGGSRLAVQQISGRGDRWQVRLGDDSRLALPERTVAAVRFKAFAEAAEKSWSAARSGELSGDVLAIARDDDLELLSGAVVAIDDSTVEFEFEGQSLSAPRAKLAGLVFFRRGASAENPRAVEVRTASGSLLRAEDISLDASAGDLRVGLAGGIGLTLPIGSLASIDYGGANLWWLDQVEILDSSAEPWLAAADPLRQRMLAPRFAAADAASGGRALVFEIPGRIELRAPEGYSKLLAVAKRSKDAAVVASVELTIRSEGRVVWSGTLGEDSDAADVAADVEPNKRFSIESRTTAAVPAGTRVVFERPRLMQQASPQ